MNDVRAASKFGVACRFLIDSGKPARVFASALATDTEAARLSFAFRSYYKIRSLLPLMVRQLLQRRRRIVETPDWYLPQVFMDALAAAVAHSAEGGLTTIHPWPNGARFAFVPTHDVETAEGMRNVERIANLEEDLGFRSSWNIVPHKYPVDHGLIRDLQDRGFEIGVHGYNHDGKLFASRSIFDGRVPAINAALKSFQAVGFRAPMVHRNLEWLQALDIEYDASYFDIDPYQAMPGGVGGMWPFMAGRFVELPYTLPQDHTLFIALAKHDGTIWEHKLDYVARQGGMAMFITHPDYLDRAERLAAYQQLLEQARSLDGMWHTLPRDAARWWRDRDRLAIEIDAEGRPVIRGPAAARGRVATLRYNDDSTNGVQWADVDSFTRSSAAEPSLL